MSERQPYAFRRNMSWAWHDIKRVSKNWRDCNLRYEIRGIFMEIFNGIFRIGK